MTGRSQSGGPSGLILAEKSRISSGALPVSCASRFRFPPCPSVVMGACKKKASRIPRSGIRDADISSLQYTPAISEPQSARVNRRYLPWKRYSGFRIILSAAPSHLTTVTFAAFVPGYSGGTTTDLHRLPDSNVSNDGMACWAPMSTYFSDNQSNNVVER